MFILNGYFVLNVKTRPHEKIYPYYCMVYWCIIFT